MAVDPPGDSGNTVTGAAYRPPLAGVRVIDVGTRISAPFCAGLLGDMGAEVIKVEDPRGGDFMRTIGPFVPTDGDGPDYSMWWAVEGRGRKGITLDLRQPAGQELFRRLAATADVVCENFRPGAMEAWGIGPDDCDPRLVWARISVFGQDGPYSGRTGLDRMGIAYGGLLHLTGYPDRPPVRPGVSISDYLTGTFAASAVNAALYRRDGPGGHRHGAGSSTPRCTARSCVSSNGPSPPRTAWASPASGRATGWPPRPPSTTTPPRTAPSSASSPAPTSTSAGCARRWATPELADEEQWSTLAKRAARSDEINDRVASWTSSLTAAEIEAACIAHEVPVGTAYAATDILADPHFAARGDLVEIDDPVAGPHRQQAPFPRLDGRRPCAPRPAPLLGEHNDEVWREIVGLGDAELDRYRADGVI